MTNIINSQHVHTYIVNVGQAVTNAKLGTRHCTTSVASSNPNVDSHSHVFTKKQRLRTVLKASSMHIAACQSLGVGLDQSGLGT